MIVCGVDPDTKGGVACAYSNGTLTACAMPMTNTGAYDIPRINLMMDNDIPIYLESVAGGHPRVLECMTIVRTICAVNGYRLVEVSPQRWRGWWGIPSGADAHKWVVDLARARWPDMTWRKKGHGRATAALIAAYGLHREIKARQISSDAGRSAAEADR